MEGFRRGGRASGRLAMIGPFHMQSTAYRCAKTKVHPGMLMKTLDGLRETGYGLSKGVVAQTVPILSGSAVLT